MSLRGERRRLRAVALEKDLGIVPLKLERFPCGVCGVLAPPFAAYCSGRCSSVAALQAIADRGA